MIFNIQNIKTKKKHTKKMTNFKKNSSIKTKKILISNLNISSYQKIQSKRRSKTLKDLLRLVVHAARRQVWTYICHWTQNRPFHRQVPQRTWCTSKYLLASRICQWPDVSVIPGYLYDFHTIHMLIWCIDCKKKHYTSVVHILTFKLKLKRTNNLP